MSADVVLRRAERNNLPSLAGDYYRGPNAELILELRKREVDAFLGIENEKGHYTVIALEGILARNSSGIEKTIPFSEVLLTLQKNALMIGKGGYFEYLPTNHHGHIWMKDGPTMCAIWNILIMMSKWDS